MSKSNRRKAMKKNPVTRRGVILVASLAVLILVINIITASYSWFETGAQDGGSVAYTSDEYLRSENCDAPDTHRGTLVTAENRESLKMYIGEINYPPESITGSITIEAGATEYFKTNIINRNTSYGTDVSLFFSSIGSADCDLTFAVTYPTNSVREIKEAKTDYGIIRNAYIKPFVATDVNGPGLLEVEWFVTNNSSSSISIDLSNIYLTYN